MPPSKEQLRDPYVLIDKLVELNTISTQKVSEQLIELKALVNNLVSITGNIQQNHMSLKTEVDGYRDQHRQMWDSYFGVDDGGGTLTEHRDLKKNVDEWKSQLKLIGWLFGVVSVVDTIMSVMEFLKMIHGG